MVPAAAPRHLTLVLLVLSALALGCTSKSDASLRALETRVVRLEQAAASGGAATAVGKVVTFKEFGFSLPLPEGAEVKSGGLSGGKPGKDEGQLSAVAGGVTMAMVWTKQVIPPNAAMYWSCFPMGSLRRSISIAHACSANSWGCTRFLRHVCSALRSAVVKLPDDPSPVPAGMSAMHFSVARLT